MHNIKILLKTHRLKGKFYAFYIVPEGIRTMNVSTCRTHIICMQMGVSFCPMHAESHCQDDGRHYLCSVRTYRQSPRFLNWCVAKNSSCK